MNLSRATNIHTRTLTSARAKGSRPAEDGRRDRAQGTGPPAMAFPRVGATTGILGVPVAVGLVTPLFGMIVGEGRWPLSWRSS